MRISPSRSELQPLWHLLATSLGVLFCAAFIGVLLFLRSRDLMQTQLKERLRTMASLTAMQFDGDQLDAVRSRNDTRSPEYRQLVRELQRIRERASDVKSVYIMRKTADPSTLAFVADADAALTPAELDTNGNGAIDANEVVPLPGDPYAITLAPIMGMEAFLRPSVDPAVTRDQWGSTISGYAPIARRSNGEVNAILGIDMDAADYTALSQSVLSPFLLLLLVLGGGCLAGAVVLSAWRKRIESIRQIDGERRGLLLLASHQLGEPLTILQWSLEELLDQLESQNLRGVVDEHIAQLQMGIARMNQILLTLRRATEIQEGQLGLKLERFELDTILKAVAQENEVLVRKMGKTLTLSLEPGLAVRADAQLLRSVIMELLDNALHFSPEGTEVIIACVRDGKHAVITVRDHGCGISAEDMPRLFQKFVRGVDAAKYKPDGNGLGLFIAHGIVSRAGGTLWAESGQGKGTTLYIRLPLVA